MLRCCIALRVTNKGGEEMEKENLLDFLSRCRVLNNLQRCNQLNRSQSYSVAEHSYHCAMLAIILCDLEFHLYKRILNKAAIVQMVLFHDLPEAITGDILYPIKQYLGDIVKDMEERVIKEQLFVGLPVEKMAGDYISLLEGLNESTTESKMVRAIDKLEVALYAIEELKVGNKSFTDLLENALSILEDEDHYGFESVKHIVYLVRTQQKENKCCKTCSCYQLPTFK